MDYIEYAYPKENYLTSTKKIASNSSDSDVEFGGFINNTSISYWIIDDTLTGNFRSVRIVLRNINPAPNRMINLNAFSVIKRYYFGKYTLRGTLNSQSPRYYNVTSFLQSEFNGLTINQINQLTINFTTFVNANFSGNLGQIPLNDCYIDSIVDFNNLNNITFIHPGNANIPANIQALRYSKIVPANFNLEHVQSETQRNIIMGFNNNNNPLIIGNLIPRAPQLRPPTTNPPVNHSETFGIFAVSNLDILYGYNNPISNTKIRIDNTGLIDDLSAIISLGTNNTAPFGFDYLNQPLFLDGQVPPTATRPVGLPPSLDISGIANQFVISVFRRLRPMVATIDNIERMDLILPNTIMNLNQTNYLTINFNAVNWNNLTSQYNNIVVVLNGTNINNVIGTSFIYP
jgi:hypothetical protein